MKDAECVEFLQWALPHLRLRWEGFRRVRKQVCKRVQRRIRVSGLEGIEAYREHLRVRPEEWQLLDKACRITISRFYRDQGVFRSLEEHVLPELAQKASARGEGSLRVWSAGCGCGEEPYTLALLWHEALSGQFPGLDLRILATDADEMLLRRARRACFAAGSLRGLPRPWLERAFELTPDGYCLKSAYKTSIEFLQHDVRTEPPTGNFDLILCRNLVFTYFESDLQRQVMALLSNVLRKGGALVLGAHEHLPHDTEGFTVWQGALCTYQKTRVVQP